MALLPFETMATTAPPRDFTCCTFENDLVIERVARSDDHTRHVMVDQCDRTVLHLGCGIALGVDVGNLFQFQSAFERSGVVVAAAEIEEIVGIGEDA